MLHAVTLLSTENRPNHVIHIQSNRYVVSWFIQPCQAHVKGWNIAAEQPEQGPGVTVSMGVCVLKLTCDLFTPIIVHVTLSLAL